MHRTAGLLLSLPILLMASPAPAVDSTADQAAIREVDREMVAALNARDVDRYLSHLAEDATWMPPNQPAVVGKAAIRELVSHLLEIPNFTVAHHPRTLEVSLSGDLGCMSYTYEFTVKDAKGTAVTEKGKDISVYKKVGDSWKLLIDMWNSDAPEANEPE
jgi:uncharacterized protein (TIGR02246 family)